MVRRNDKAGPFMRLKVHLGALTIRKWHIELLNKLAAQTGWSVAAELSRPGTPGPGDVSPSNLDLLFQLETLIHGISGDGLASRIPATLLEPYLRNAGSFDLVLDLSGNAGPQYCRVWQLVFDGLPGENALLRLLIGGQSPVAEIRECGTTVVVGRLGTEYNGILLFAFEDFLARTITLIMAAFVGAASNQLPPIAADIPRRDVSRGISAHSLTAQALKELTWRISAVIYRLCYNSPHWRVGWRKMIGPDTLELGCHPESGWRDLSDDGSRFYADPFPLQFRDRLTLFVEDFEHRTAKGIISAVSFNAHGPVGRPEPVFELPYHLSYPFVFVWDDQAWMIPESTAAGSIDLFRSTNFPGGWVKEATLVSSVVASDPTLFQHDGRWWLFATVRDGGGAFSDALHLWSAVDIRGPWLPHSKNPVLIDIASARPAGRIVLRNGTLFRPVQDCRLGYGQALGIARILTLDDNRYEQTVDRILTTGPAWPGRRIHTLNSDGGFEFIDGSARSGLAFG
jgi:hypothetical protein